MHQYPIIGNNDLYIHLSKLINQIFYSLSQRQIIFKVLILKAKKENYITFTIVIYL